jgi:hypothetical protein
MTRFSFGRNRVALAPLWLAAGCLLALAGCGAEPRTSDEIFREERELPALYITVKTHTRVTAPAGKGMFIDPGTGEAAWPALACQNPDCPSRGAGGEPNLFIDAGPTAGQPGGAPAVDSHGCCPACVKGLNWKSLPPAERQKYINWVKPYVLPESQKRLAELAAERKQLSEQSGK